MAYVSLFMAIMFIAFGVMIKHFKWYWLIAGYNTMPKEKKEKVDTEGLGKLMGTYCFTTGGMMILASVLIALGYHWVMMVSVILIVLLTIGLLVKAQSFDPSALKEDGSMKGSTKIIIVSVIIVTLVTGGLVILGMQPTEIVIGETALDIRGGYGERIEYASIDSIEMVEVLPIIEMRTNGFAAGSVKKGNFRLEGIGAAKLFIYENNPPFIELRAGERLLFLNHKDKEETKQIYEQIKRKIVK